MKKIVYCSQCGASLEVFRKAFQGNIINLIPPHECKEVCEPDFEPLEIPPVEVQKENEFVQKLDNLRSLPPTADLRDRRPTDQVKTTAPPNLLNNLPSTPNSTPEGSLEDPDEVS